jgi:hypothetical protein
VDLLVIEQRRQPDPSSGNGTFFERVHTLTNTAGGWFSVEQREDVGHVELWVCEACGYMEAYAQDFKRLREVADQPGSGVRRVRAKPRGYRD